MQERAQKNGQPRSVVVNEFARYGTPEEEHEGFGGRDPGNCAGAVRRELVVLVVVLEDADTCSDFSGSS